MQDYTIYADLTFLINLVMDFLILWATGKMSGIQTTWPRLVMGAVLGGLYAVGNLFPPLAALYTLPLKILISICLILFALRPTGWSEFKKACLYFYIISFLAGGTTLAACYLYPDQGGELSVLWLPAGMLSIGFIGYYGARYMRTSIIPELLRFSVKIRFNNDVCSGQGFLDTGNSLRDPATNRPVVVAEYRFLEQMLPEDLKQVMEDINNEKQGLDALGNTSWSHRLRLIPFTSIGKKNGLLIGVRADEIVVSTGHKSMQHDNMVIGLYRDSLSRDGKYQMLIPSEMLN